ncbi:phosphate/phosphite/phosphonate ABC transporter substrate-binding protein [candidate division CSSED10-310 bacterium]|uniref:Phosphate/phosphite/phosphonate ABC transporter substrate-binding protein n=1 Tax=candidate division CSSED10-310 bacterium TaxID=2855610 RepID=A0ABV6YXX5_UNCC1
MNSKVVVGVIMSLLWLGLPAISYQQEIETSRIPDYIKKWGSEDSEIIDFVYFLPDAPLDLTTALKLWQPVMKEYKERLRFPRPLRIMFFKQSQELEKIFRQRPVALAFLPVDYYLENRKRLKMKPYATFVISTEPKYSFILLTRKNSPYKSWRDLKGKKLATTMAADNKSLFISRIIFRGQLSVDDFFSDVIYPQDGYSTLQALRINLADAALISEYNIKFLSELDPGYSKNFVELYKSPLIPAPPFVYFEEYISESDLKEFLQVTREISEKPAVKQALLFLKLESMMVVTEKDYQEAERLWQAGKIKKK